MAATGGLAGLCFAVSARLMIAGPTCSLALLLAQGFYLEPADAPEAFVLGTGGGLLQAAAALAALAFLRPSAGALVAGRGRARLRRHPEGEPDSRFLGLRHGVRFGAALGLGVAFTESSTSATTATGYR